MVVIIFFLAIYGLIVSDNLLKKIMCLNIIHSMMILIFILSVYVEDYQAPFLISENLLAYVSPLPQAIMLTAIVIGVCFNAIAVIFIVKLYYKYRTINVSELLDY